MGVNDSIFTYRSLAYFADSCQQLTPKSERENSFQPCMYLYLTVVYVI